MRKHIALRASACTITLVTILAACSSSDSSSLDIEDADIDTSSGLVIDGEEIADEETYEAAQDQTVTLYTGYQEANQKEFNETFTEDTGIEVEYVRDVANKLSERIQSEAGADELGADVIITSDYAVAQELTDADLLESYEPSTVEQGSDLVLEDSAFTTFANVVVTFAYNTQEVKKEEAPSAWTDLLDPAYKGELGLTSGTAGGSSIALNRFVQEEVDPKFWEKLAAQEPTVFDSGGQRQEALARGELSVATAGTAAVNVAVAEDGAPLEYVVPDEGLVLFSFFVGKTKATGKDEAAEVFIDYALSKRGQSLISKVGDYSVRTDVEPPTANGKELPALDSDEVWIMKPEDEVEYGPEDAQVWKDALD